MLLHILISLSFSANIYPIIPNSIIKGYFPPDQNAVYQSCHSDNKTYNSFKFLCESIDPATNFHPDYLYSVAETEIKIIDSDTCPSGQTKVFNTCITTANSDADYAPICGNLYSNDKLQECSNIISLFYISHTAKKVHPQAFQFLVNQIVLLNYPLLITPPYSEIFFNSPLNFEGYTYWPENFPFFTYLTQTSLTSILEENYITTKYNFEQVSQFYLARYKWNGEFVGFTPLTNQLDKCGQKNDISQAWRKFGTSITKECYFDLTRDIEEETNDFFEIFIEDGSTSEGVIMRPVPILFNGNIARRFYIFNNYTTNHVKFVNSATITFEELSSDAKSTTIKTPYFEFTTRDVLKSSVSQLNSEIRFKSDSDQHPQYTFKVVYSTSLGKFIQVFLIGSIVLAVFTIFLMVLRFISIANADRSSLNNIRSFLLGLCIFFEYAGIFFFILDFAFSIFVCIFFKFQKAFYWCMPENFKTFNLMRIFLFVSFGTLLIGVLIEIFALQLKNFFVIIDWEMPGSHGAPVSAWRRINVSNELNRISTIRSYNIPFTVITIAFILTGFDVEYLSAPIPTTQLIDIGQSHWVLRFGVSAFCWVLLMAVQYIWFHFIYWRFYGNPYFNFLDLCHTSNLSLFIVTSDVHGYYLHGKSLQGHSDVDMKKLSQALIDEEKGIIGLRGLIPNTPDQVFELFLTREFALQFSQTRQTLENQIGMNRFRFTANDVSQDTLALYDNLNSFLRMFIEGTSEFKYIVQDPGSEKANIECVQKIFRVYPLIMRETFMNKLKDILYKRALLAGSEWSLMILYMAVFCLIDILTESPCIGCFVVYLLDLIITSIYSRVFKYRLGKSSLLDHRFFL